MTHHITLNHNYIKMSKGRSHNLLYTQFIIIASFIPLATTFGKSQLNIKEAVISRYKKVFAEIKTVLIQYVSV